MNRITFGTKLIASSGYDAQMAVLVIEFAQTGQVIRYMDVSEEIWYGFKTSYFPDQFFQHHIMGRFEEHRL